PRWPGPRRRRRDRGAPRTPGPTRGLGLTLGYTRRHASIDPHRSRLRDRYRAAPIVVRDLRHRHVLDGGRGAAALLPGLGARHVLGHRRADLDPLLLLGARP